MIDVAQLQPGEHMEHQIDQGQEEGEGMTLIPEHDSQQATRHAQQQVETLCP